jgi:predicted ATPase
VQISADLVAQAVAKTLRIPDSPGVPLLDGVLEHLLHRQLLLVLDNCEHLIEGCAALVESVLSSCPQVTILATSREGLGVPGEIAWSLPSLSLPEMALASDTTQIFRSEAVSLFIERAADVLPGYQPGEKEAPTIAQICLHLDGIPLAHELWKITVGVLPIPDLWV